MSVEVLDGGTIVVTGEHMDLYRLLTIKSGLKMEMKQEERGDGKVTMRLTRGPLMSSRLRKEFGFKGNRTAQLAQLESYIEDRFPRMQSVTS